MTQAHLTMLVNVLSVALLFVLCAAYMLGDGAYGKDKAHVSAIIASVILTVAILGTVEFGLVPFLGRHYGVVFFFHLFFLAGALLFGVSAASVMIRAKRNNTQSTARWLHRRLGSPAIGCWVIAVLLGLIIANQ